MSNIIFKGAATALITPFRDGKVDTEAFERIIETQIAEGIDALVVCGTTGESATLATEEKRRLIECCVKTAAGRVPVIAGTGSNDTAATVSLTRFAKEAGADGVLLVTPYYNKPGEEGLYRHFTRVAEAVDIPIVLYNVPARTGVTLSAELIVRLAAHENIIGLKEAGDSLYAAAVTAALGGKDFSLYAGNDNVTVPMIALGGKGVISVASNLIPRRMHEMCRAALDGDIHGAAEEQMKLLPLMKALFCETNPIPVKTAMAMCGYCHAEFRLPLCGMGAEKREELRGTLAAYGII